MTLYGHSNYLIEVKFGDGCFIVTKKAQDIRDFKRLCAQIHKQKNFHYFVKNHKNLKYFFEIPEVLDMELEQNSAVMKFCNGKSILDIIEQEDIFILDTILDEIFLFLQWELDNSPSHLVSSEDWLNKIKELENKIKDKRITPILQELKKDYKKKIPIGICHGDLTLNNMLFSNKIILLDFLDSFIETPLIDITKLMQEFNLKWSLLISNEGRDNSKIEIGYNYLKRKFDKKLQEFIKINSINLDTLDMFYKMTLIRILPYSKSDKISNAIYVGLK